MLMKPRLQTRSHAGGASPHRCPEGLRVSTRFAPIPALNPAARACAAGPTVCFPSLLPAVPAGLGASGA